LAVSRFPAVEVALRTIQITRREKSPYSNPDPLRLDTRCTLTKSSQFLLEQRFAHAVTCLERLILEVSVGTTSAASWDVARAALESLPLTTDECATARNRLENARRYFETGEHGAANYELRLLARSATHN
jgi:hypothetical protein